MNIIRTLRRLFIQDAADQENQIERQRHVINDQGKALIMWRRAYDGAFNQVRDLTNTVLAVKSANERLTESLSKSKDLSLKLNARYARLRMALSGPVADLVAVVKELDGEFRSDWSTRCCRKPLDTSKESAGV